jgi:hypothetical protein
MPGRVHPAFARIDHRPWPLPERAWTSRQTWNDSLFARGPMPVSALRPLNPARARSGRARRQHPSVGLVPFRMTDVMLRGLPDLPGISTFPENSSP